MIGIALRGMVCDEGVFGLFVRELAVIELSCGF